VSGVRAIFWADCGAGVGLGHIGRTAAVAGAWLAAGHEPVIVLPESRGEDLIAGESLPAPRVGNVQALVADGVRAGAAIAVLDSYRLEPGVVAALRARGMKVAAFDDHGRDDAGADVVINGAPGAEARMPARRPRAVYLLGAAFFPLRRAFAMLRQPRVVNDTVGAVVATAGGEDVHGRLRLMVEAALTAFPEARVRAASVPGAVLDGLPPRVDVTAAGSRLAACLQTADVVVCGGGQTLVEAAALGTPAAAMVLGEDQRSQHGAMVAAGAALDAGSWDQPLERQRAALAAALAVMAAGAVRSAMSQRGRALVDGNGAARVASALAGVAAGRVS
jgi:spore coat polysaccharide biosynthesis predicted glycosyltransferase SpsG